MTPKLPAKEAGESFTVSSELDAAKRVPFFALVIGINSYHNVPKLGGAVADADDINAYLHSSLGVPKDQIFNLRDEGATRENIINGFKILQKNPDIKRGDAILIYYAGHGCELDPPLGWETGGNKMQGIVPQDIGMEKPPIYAIPDRVIGALLSGLAQEKGDNITVILDCCHAFSGTRDPVRTARMADVKGSLPANLDQNILDTHVQKDAVDLPVVPGPVTNSNQNEKYSRVESHAETGFLQPDLHTHVVLAACGDKESAWESHGRGDFTTAFLKILRKPGADKLTYIKLMKELPILTNQNPHCEGYYQGRILFNSTIPNVDHSFINVEQDGTKYTLGAGGARGVTEKSEFTVHAYDKFDLTLNPALGTLRVTSTSASRATLERLDNAPAFQFPNPAYARQASCGPDQELRVHFTDALKLVLSIDDVRGAALASKEADIGFTVTDAGTADYVVDLLKTSKGQRAVFSTTNLLAKRYGLERLPHDVQATGEELAYVLRRLAHWNWHFKRANPGPFSEKIRLEFYHLEQCDYDEDGMAMLKPDGGDMNTTGVVELVSNTYDLFGVRIVNGTKRDLYPYLFYFDVSDQSITQRNIRSMQACQVPLPAGSTFAIGYGAGGDAPLTFSLREGETMDVGFLKIFFTSSPTDFDSLEQKSPFYGRRTMLSPSDAMERVKKLELWGAVMTTVVQHITPSVRSDD